MNEKHQSSIKDLTKKELFHELKIEYIRYCVIYNKTFKETQEFFKAKKISLSESTWRTLKLEIHNSKYAKNWFSKEALYVIEQDHMISVERIKIMDNQLFSEFITLQKTFDKTPEDIALLLSIVARYQAVQETKTKMFSATPMVQEMAEIRDRRESEDELWNTPVVHITKTNNKKKVETIVLTLPGVKEYPNISNEEQLKRIREDKE